MVLMKTGITTFFLASLLWSSGKLAAFNITIDYRFDEPGNGGMHFFDPLDPDGLLARNSLEAAADSLETWLNDSFSAISPGGANTWSALFFDPRTSGTTTETVTNLHVAASSVTIFAGAFTGGSGGLLGQGSKGGYVGLAGDSPFQDSVLTRGGTAEYVMWGGMIRFKGDRLDWNLDHTSMPSGGEFDFYTVAVHELIHVLGFGQSPEWDNQRISFIFTGPESVAVYNRTDADTANPSNPVPLDDPDHWDNALQSIVASDGLTTQDVLMGPQLLPGQRLEITELDLAGMSDIGWEVTPIPEPATVSLLIGLVAFWVGLRSKRNHRADGYAS